MYYNLLRVQRDNETADMQFNQVQTEYFPTVYALTPRTDNQFIIRENGLI